MGRFTRAYGPFCREPYVGECRQFSTDGTRLGAEIAHEFSTTDEEEIKETNETGTIRDNVKRLTGMDAEQPEWESTDSEAWGAW
jgi:hypothetical protein